MHLIKFNEDLYGEDRFVYKEEWKKLQIYPSKRGK